MNIHDEDGAEWHFALYSPIWGWRAYRWDWSQYGLPYKIYCVTENAAWVSTTRNCVMRLKIKPNGKLNIMAKMENCSLIGANKNVCVLYDRYSESTIRLHLNEDGKMVCTPVVTGGVWAHFLPDITIITTDITERELFLCSPDGKVIRLGALQYGHYYCYFPPFILHYDNDCLCYANDPREGWHRISVFKVHQERTGEGGRVTWIGRHSDACYIAIEHGDDHSDHRLSLYRSSSKSPDRVENVWEIQIARWGCGVAQYNGLICIVSDSICGAHIPDNNGFLAWSMSENTFYTDIFHATSIHKISSGRISTVRVPGIWGRSMS